jgi:hypothetical protein
MSPLLPGYTTPDERYRAKPGTATSRLLTSTDKES